MLFTKLTVYSVINVIQDKQNNIYTYNVINADKNEKTVLATHHFEDRHNFNFSNVTIRDREPNDL